ncbi:hypothetical protein N7504_003312 [Penicillium tannophilum]|nr:hypothetical protein N7504_003312 [Penicillium tannophilum]
MHSYLLYVAFFTSIAFASSIPRDIPDSENPWSKQERDDFRKCMDQKLHQEDETVDALLGPIVDGKLNEQQQALQTMFFHDNVRKDCYRIVDISPPWA